MEIEFAGQYSDSYSENFVSFVNNVRTADGGSHEVGARSGFTRAFNDYAKKQGLLGKKGQEPGRVRLPRRAQRRFERQDPGRTARI